jgi:hypothetical protein
LADDEEAYEDEQDLKNDEWFKNNYLELMEKYPREWIAVAEQKVIANGARRIEVEDKATELLGKDGEYSMYYVLPTDMSTDVGYAQR